MDRQIFKFNDGTRDRYADPIALDLRINKAFQKIDVDSVFRDFDGPPWLPEFIETGEVPAAAGDIGMVHAALDARREAMRQLIPALFEGFGCTPLDESTGEGTTAAEVLGIYNDFLNYQTDIKKNTESTPNSSPPTVSIDRSPPMRSMSASG